MCKVARLSNTLKKDFSLVSSQFFSITYIYKNCSENGLASKKFSPVPKYANLAVVY